MPKRLLAAAVAAVALACAGFLYTAHPAHGSDHQDTYNLTHRPNTSADITDVFVFPSPTNASNVVFVMNVSPLIPAGMGLTKFFDPSLMWQFKIAHGAANPEDQVMQLGVTGADANQVITLYGPSKPNEVGTGNTFVSSPSVSFKYNTVSNLGNGIMAFAGPRADPFYFDLFQFFSFLGDRNAMNHTSQTDPGTGDMLTGTPTFNGFAAGTMSSTGASAYACSTKPSTNALTDLNGGFNVLSYVIEVPRTLLTSGFASQTIHVWGTTNSSTGS